MHNEHTYFGYLHFYYKSLSRFSRQWDLPCCSFQEFKELAIGDLEYERIFKLWIDSNFNKHFMPWVSRDIRSKGFIIGNLSWKNNDHNEINKEKFEDIKKSNQEKWSAIKNNHKLMKYYRWNGTLTKYKLTRKDWNKLVKDSNGYCMLLGEQFKNASNDCHIDHDHKTGKVRGLICARCNHLLAGLDDLKFKKQAEKYLS